MHYHYTLPLPHLWWYSKTGTPDQTVLGTIWTVSTLFSQTCLFENCDRIKGHWDLEIGKKMMRVTKKYLSKFFTIINFLKIHFVNWFKMPQHRSRLWFIIWLFYDTYMYFQVRKQVYNDEILISVHVF